MKAYGKTTWLIPDTFLDSVSKNAGISHEAICVINTSDVDAKIQFTLFFEDREARTDFSSQCPAMRTHHIRMDKLRNAAGEPIPRDTPYAVLVESNTPIVVQYSRLDTSAPEMALMTTISLIVFFIRFFQLRPEFAVCDRVAAECFSSHAAAELLTMFDSLRH